MAFRKPLKRGDVILDEHEYISYIPIVTEGSVKVMQSDEDYQEMLL